MARSRISTGFHRIGFVLAVPMIVVAGVAAFVAWNTAPWPSLCTNVFEQFDARSTCKLVVMQKSGGILVRGPLGAPMQFPSDATATEMRAAIQQYRASLPNQAALEPIPSDLTPGTAHPDYLWAWLALATAALLYAASWALGWIIDGFAGSKAARE
ncbi:hypothetical protein AFCDBAGC_0688 [Methylobacterium cerastii]|uniref:Cytochrome C n=1 Tax=Methylobacterium cerastii TaxID=932741 RepID=A0ABQ4QCU9_9HYPH|nr:hypothetical protein [Methylobacterium cerastii]GJD42846.1 hypothetical protein AFCDBAGC_0688 [Methylobacterium cerastii]